MLKSDQMGKRDRQGKGNGMSAYVIMLGRTKSLRALC